MNKHFDLDNMYCGIIRRGDVFVYEDKKGKKELVLILQDNILNESLQTVVCAIIEKYNKKNTVFANEVLLPKEELGFTNDKVCMLYKIETLDRRGMIMKKCEVSSERLEQIYTALEINCGRFRDKFIELE